MWCAKSMRKAVALFALLAVTQGMASAQEPSAAPESTSPAASATPQRVSLGAPVDAASAEFERIAAEVEVLKARAELAEAQLKLREAEQLLAGEGAAGPTTAPLLIGLYSGERASFAEFAVGTVTRRAQEGEYVADGMRLVRIGVGSVVVADASGVRRTLFLNRRAPSNSAPTAGAVQQQAVPGLGSTYVIPPSSMPTLPPGTAQ